MVTVFRWLLRIATGLIGLVVLIVAFSYYFASRSLPDYSEDYNVTGITAPVEIVRDNSDVPHIFGQNDSDVFYALGFAHAQDRMWQMITQRRMAQGRLSELFGARTVSSDALMRRLDLYNLSVASVAAQDEYTKGALEAYSNGVNAWLDEVNEGARGRGAPEMWLFNQPVAPWQPADSIALMKLYAFQQSAQIEGEVLRFNLSKLLPTERLADIMPDAPGPSVTALPRAAALIPNAPAATRAATVSPDLLSPVRPMNLAGASNAWAAGRDRSATGGTLLANDPHNALTAPGMWYLARLDLESGSVIGGTIPGIPVVMTGRSTNLGWGITAAYIDDIDLYVEEVNPENQNQFRTLDGWADFRSRDSIINVDGQAAVTIKLLWTDNGPILPPDQYELATVRPAGHIVSMNWTGLSDADTTMSAQMALMRAQNVREGMAAGAKQIAPGLNVMLADRLDIGMQVFGAIPNRSPMHQSQGRSPTQGYVAENRWSDRLPYTENPSAIDPETGILGNTNNKTTDAAFPRNVSFLWGDTQRINRLQRLMQTRAVHTRDSMIEAQLDTVSFTARSLLPLVGAELWFTGESAPAGTIEAQRQQALQMLANWNGEMYEHLPEPLIYAAWMRALQTRLVQDELGDLTGRLTQVEPVFIERVFRNTNGAGVWCDVIQSEPVETCPEIARLALDDAIIWITEKYGPALESLRWGDAHSATHKHTVLGDTPFLKWVTNVVQSTSGGDNTLMRGVTSGMDPDPFQNVHAAGYRGVYDFADPDSSVFITTMGQSGHPLSRYYDNLGELWRRGEYIPMSLDPSLARAAAVGITHLMPEQAQ